MKKITVLILAFILLFSLTSCGQKAPTWQEQYDLGIRYLEEGNYAEAIIAFTAAIEIDPKRAEAYICRGGAYIFSGETDENLAAALADYEQAVELDDTNADAYLGLADVYIRLGEYDKAYAILRDGLVKTGNSQSIAEKIAEIESGIYADSSQHIRRSNSYEMDGTLSNYTLYKYDFLGRCSGWDNYWREEDEQGNPGETLILQNYCEVDFDEENRPSQYRFYGPDGTPEEHDSFVYNEKGLKTEQHRFSADGVEQVYFLFYYNEQGQEIKYEGYHADGSMYGYWISEYDAAGNLVKETAYDSDGTIREYELYE